MNLVFNSYYTYDVAQQKDQLISSLPMIFPENMLPVHLDIKESKNTEKNITIDLY